MKAKAHVFLMLAALSTPMVAVAAEDALHRAVVHARQQRDAAAAAVAFAQNQLAKARDEARRAQEVAVEAQMRHDVAAEVSAREVVRTASENIGVAGELLQRSNTLLSARNNVFLRLQREEGRPQSLPQAFMLPDGAVSRYGADGSPVADAVIPLQAGERIVTGTAGSARLFMADGDAALQEKGELVLTGDVAVPGSRVELRQGVLHVVSPAGAEMRTFEVRTPVAACAVQGADATLEVRPGGLHLSVREGAVRVTPAGGKPLDVRAGEQRDYEADKGFGPAQALDVKAGG